MYFRFLRHHVDISSRDVAELYMSIIASESLTMSQMRMVVSLRQKWTGGILPPVAGIRVKYFIDLKPCFYSSRDTFLTS